MHLLILSIQCELLCPFDYCSPLGTNFSSLLTFWISDKLTTGPGNFFIPGIGFFSSEVVGAPSSVSGVLSFLLGGCPAPGRKAPIGILIFAFCKDEPNFILPVILDGSDVGNWLLRHIHKVLALLSGLVYCLRTVPGGQVQKHKKRFTG